LHDSLARAPIRKRTLDLLHLEQPDVVGHEKEWDLTPGSAYLVAIAAVDLWLDTLLHALDEDEQLHGRVAIILTTDHGGGDPAKTHTNAAAPVNFTIPFLVWTGQHQPPVDLYALNQATRARPRAGENPVFSADPPPIRNGEAGNLALRILGLPAIPGSRHGARHDLRLSANEPISPPNAAIRKKPPRSAEDRTE